MATTSTRSKQRGKADRDSPGLSREVVVAAALAQLDAEGLEGFSLRTLAGRLGVFPTAIYWYVPNRNELIAQVVSLVLSNVAPTRRPKTWKLHLKAIFDGFREAVRAHPNVAPLIGTQLVSNSSIEYGLVESILDALTRAGLSGRRLLDAYNGVIAALAGFIAQEFAPLPNENTSEWQAAVRERLNSVDLKSYPLLAENMALLSNRSFILRWQNGVEAPMDSSFAGFFNLLVAGIEAAAASPKQRASATPIQ